ncbi:MAG: Acyl-coenzyme A:6-aminopenicillanic acid acyl-transferase, partial [Deltaproteobacteria bacterium]|nr:Acyl-coenzyme A:6-aminopenicillanic acid acyl-transferase [Deltaproteobacteria bacterium]
MAGRMASRVAALATGLLIVSTMAVAAGTPLGADLRAHRQDRGALIVLDLYGSYEQMGRQQVELLGATSRELGDLYAGRWRALVRAQGLFGSVVNGVILPLWAAFGGWREDSGFFEEAAGVAGALGTKGTDGVRFLYGGVFGGGSTVFAATRSATADGRAIIGRNVDWSDDSGRRRPVVARYHPENGDLVYLAASWPLIIVPIVGLNEAGLAISINFFDADDMIGLG